MGARGNIWSACRASGGGEAGAREGFGSGAGARAPHRIRQESRLEIPPRTTRHRAVSIASEEEKKTALREETDRASLARWRVVSAKNPSTSDRRDGVIIDVVHALNVLIAQLM